MVGKNKRAPEILYHYTSLESFKQIIESQKIRATRYDQMNDTSEIEIGLNLLLDAVKKYPVDSSLHDYKDFLISKIESYKEDTLEVYVLSLSEVVDSLYQWRAYAHGGGVAIGFDYKKVQKGFLLDITRKLGGKKVKNPNRPTSVNRLLKCLYTDNNGYLDQRPVIADRFFKPDSYIALFKRQESIVPSIFCASLSIAIYQMVCAIKHGAYTLEKEWRCVNYRPTPNDYPVKLSEANRLYIEMEFDPKNFIREVWISPHGNRESCENTVAYFKQNNNLQYAIKNSKIPLREKTPL